MTLHIYIYILYQQSTTLYKLTLFMSLIYIPQSCIWKVKVSVQTIAGSERRVQKAFGEREQVEEGHLWRLKRPYCAETPIITLHTHANHQRVPGRPICTAGLCWTRDRPSAVQNPCMYFLGGLFIYSCMDGILFDLCLFLLCWRPFGGGSENHVALHSQPLHCFTTTAQYNDIPETYIFLITIETLTNL